MLPANYNQSTLLVTQLDEGATKELIYQQLKKFGQIKSLRHFPKTKSAQVEFQTLEEAKAAKSSLNHNKLLNKEINIVNFQNKDEFMQKKKYNIFIHNVPSDLETSYLHNFMSKYGEIISLMLKKNEENKNLGYGYVQFETEEAFNEVLKEQEEKGKIYVPNSNFSFNVQKMIDSNKIKSNSIEILDLYEQKILPNQKDEKTKQITQLFEQIKIDLQVTHFNFNIQYSEAMQNFIIKIDFQYDNQEQEECIYKTVKEQVKNNFQRKETQNKGPQIIFNLNERGRKTVILQKVKLDISTQKMADWILKNINVMVPVDNIKIKKIKFIYDQLNITIEFISDTDSLKFVDFCHNPSNINFVDQILQLETDQNGKIYLPAYRIRQNIPISQQSQSYHASTKNALLQKLIAFGSSNLYKNNE